MSLSAVNKRRVAGGVAAVALVAIGLGVGVPDGAGRHHSGAPIPRGITRVEAATPKPAPEPLSPKIAKLHPNEDGVVPILMYHNLQADHIYQMNYPVALFKKDLQWLYEHDYRPISLTDFAKGRIDCPAGKSPVILTFDDGDRTQFHYLKDGSMDPNCAVAILEKFHDDHPDWKLRGTFFVIAQAPVPFTQPHQIGKKLKYLVQDGFDIGNHTVHHPFMNRLSDSAVKAEIAGCARMIHHYLPDYDVDTIALPYGVFPKDRELLVDGNTNGVSYHNICAMAAGWRPSPSPVDKRFKPYEVERLQAGDKEDESHYWLSYLEKHKDSKFVSDGDPDVYTIPVTKVGHVNRARLEKLGFTLRTYGTLPHK